MKLKKGDTVRVITGKDKGKEGVVQRVLPAENKVIVSGVNIAAKHQRARRANEQGKIATFPDIYKLDPPIAAAILGKGAKPEAVADNAEPASPKPAALPAPSADPAPTAATRSAPPPPPPASGFAGAAP